MFRDAEVVRAHLLDKGFADNYTTWSKHGETSNDPSVSHTVEIEGRAAGRNAPVNVDDWTDTGNVGADTGNIGADTDNVGADSADHGANDGGNDLDVEEMLRHVEPQALNNLETLQKASKDLLYEESKGCAENCTVLRTVLELMKLKAVHSWSDASFTDLLQLLSDVLPKPNLLPDSTYSAKKVLSPLSLGVEKIHACPNHCILYRGDHKDAKVCPICGHSRYKKNVDYECDNDDTTLGQGKKKNKSRVGQKRKKSTTVEVDDDNERKIPALVMWYLPVVDRLRRFFANERDAALMTWHKQRGDGMIRHPKDGSQWKRFDADHREFAEEARNIRFALSTDGMNPFGQMRNPHSTWPVIMSMYNIPSWLCHKRKYLLLVVLISGPRQPCDDIDVFLEPLMEDMQKLWLEGVRMWDQAKKEYFQLKAIIFCTISDSPALRTLSGQKKGHVACVVCVDDTSHLYLQGSKKTVYPGNRRFLPSKHKYRKQSSRFDGTVETRPPPKRCTGKVMFEMVKNIKIVYGKRRKKGVQKSKTPKTCPFKKQSIFFRYLDYWKELEVPHAFDWMHVGKGVFDSTIGLLLDMPGKTKDGLPARNDLVHLNIKPELHPVERENGKHYLPPASYNLTKEEKTAFCKCLRGIRVPTGFSSNVKNLVNMEELKVSGYNTHDCHAMLSLFLAIAIRAIKPEHVKLIVTRMCYFFNAIGKKAHTLDELNKLRADMRETMCMLEECFPLSFFDQMEHFMIHIVDQVLAIGPVYLHHMFPFERYMYVMKRYVRTRSHPEGSMIEGYTTEEVIECCMDYIQDGRPIGIPVSRHEGRLSGKGISGRRSFNHRDYGEVDKAHFSVLHQVQLATTYVEQHTAKLKRENEDKSNEWIENEHKHSFTSWLRDLDLPSGDSPDEILIRRLAGRPSRMVVSFEAYDINGFTFHTYNKDKKSKCQNSGVRAQAYDAQGELTSYYGYIEEIWELDYGGNVQIPIFRCKWAEGVEVDEYGFNIVDLNRVGFKDDPWILARSVEQVFYILDPKDEKKYIVVPGKQRIVGVENVEDGDEYNQYDEVPFFVNPENLVRVQTRLTYSKQLPYVRTDCDGRTV